MQTCPFLLLLGWSPVPFGGLFRHGCLGNRGLLVSLHGRAPGSRSLGHCMVSSGSGVGASQGGHVSWHTLVFRLSGSSAGVLIRRGNFPWVGLFKMASWVGRGGAKGTFRAGGLVIIPRQSH